MKYLSRAVVVLLISTILQRISAVDLKATTAYDGDTCAALGSISVVLGACSSSTCDSGTGIICMTDSNYKAQIAAAFSVKSVPYVTISTFSTGSCPPANLVTAMTYAADGLCHPMAGTNIFFRVTIYNITSNAGSSDRVAAITTYSTPECSGGGAPIKTLYKSDLTTNSGCSGTTQTELSLDWPQEVIPMTLKITVEYNDDCSTRLGPLSLIPQTCSTGTSSSSLFCSSGVGIACTSYVKYKTVLDDAFGTPYIAIWTYSGSACSLLTLVRVQVYAADGQCHPIGSKFYKVTIKADLTTLFANYSDAGCTTADGVALQVTAQKLTTGCDNQAQASRLEVSTNYPVAVVKTLVYFDGLDCTKTVGSVQMTATSSTCIATVCSSGSKTFCSTNYNYETTVATAFGMIPYITVSKFSGNACTAATLVSAISYVADGLCHPLGNGKYYSVATQITNEQIMTIRKYTDNGCSNSDKSDISVTKTLLTTNLGCDAAQATQYKVSGTVQQSSGVTLRVVSAFDDGDCTKTLGSVIISPGSCTSSESSCFAGTWTTCTTNYNYETAIAAAFKSARYVVVSMFWGSTCSWMTLESATAYAADGSCHSLGMKYFKVAVNNGNAVISTYTDPSCTTLENTKTISVTTTSGCNSGTKIRLTLSPNWFTRMDVVGVYAAASCTGTSSKLVLTDSGSSPCSKTCSAYNLSDCTSNSTYKSYLDTAFGTVPYLIKETYTGSTCSTRSSITAYAADGSCYVDGSQSFKVTPVAGNMVFTTFAQQSCTGSEVPTVVANSALLSNLCVSSENVKYYMGGNWRFTTSTVYNSDDSKCALTPSKFSLTLTATCTIPTTTCKSSTGYGTVFVAAGCTKASNYITTIDKAFGMTPYAVQETYATSGCTGLTDVTAYVADGLCHLGADATTSYRVTWNPTSVPAALIIETFSYGGCYSGAITPTIVSSDYIGGACVSNTKKIYIGGLTSKLTAIVTYSDSACTSPVQVVFSSPATTCTTQSKCTPAANGLYMNQGCTTDYAEFLSGLFQSTVRLVTDIYEASYNSKCATRQGIVAYIGDGVCHPNIDGATSFKVTLGNTASDSTWLATYSDGGCSIRISTLEITPELLASGLCDAATSMKFVVSAGETPTPSPTPTPTTATTGSGTSSAASFLSVPALGLLTTAGGVLGGILMVFC